MKTCNLSTVKNTPNEVRRDTSSVMYYYIDYEYDDIAPNVPTWRTIRAAIETIWDTLAISDLHSLDRHYICAYMTDGTSKRVRYIRIGEEGREMRICRV